jgi:hypothetical protein
MESGFPKHTQAAAMGEIGVGIVSRIVTEEFGWLFKRNHQEHDFGIDGQIEVVTETGAVTGQMLACQIKCGASFFKESNKWGYIYRGDTKHFNYLANYPIPVIILLCNPDTKRAYWACFGPAETQITEAGWKLTVPFENKLPSTKAALEALLPEVADHLSALEEYWALNNLPIGFQYIVFMIDRQNVEDVDLSAIRHFIQRLKSSKEFALHCQGKIEIGFGGYDDDPRELFEIEDVRRYVALLDRDFDQLFFFARSKEPATTLRIFVFCLMGVGWIGKRSTAGTPQPVLVDFHSVPDFLPRHFDGLNLICERLGLPDEEIYRISKAVTDVLGLSGGGGTGNKASSAV